jgi:hypothetical protein
MDMYNVLDTLKKIENPTDDQQAAIKSAEMTTPQAFETQGATEVSTTGDNLYAQYGKDAHADLIRLAEVPVITVQSDIPVAESTEVTEAQSPAQKAAFQKMLDAKKGKTADKDEDDKEEVEESIEEEIIEEAYDPEHVKSIVDRHEKEGHKVQMDRPEEDAQGFTVTFNDGKRRHYKYTKTGSKVTSLEPTDPLVDPNAPKRGRGRPTKEGEEVEEGDNIYHPCTKSFTHERFGEGTVIHGEHTLAEDGTVTHYDAEFVKEDGTRYVVKNIPVANMKGAVQVEHSHPAKKRKNEGIEEEVDELTRTFEAKLAEALPEEAEVITESIQVNQNINDDGQESVSINAQGNQEHLDMLKSLLALAGQSRGYDEYQGKEEVVEPEQEAPVEENLANSPDPKYADVDTQLNKQAGGLNKPKKAYAKAQDGDNAMAVEESMFDLYKEYKGG